MIRTVEVLPLLFLLVLLFPSTILGQDIEPVYTGSINLVTEPSGAEVYADDSLLGTAPMILSAGIVPELRIWYPSRRDWNAQMKKVENPVISERQGVILVSFDCIIKVNSTPYGAAVLFGDSLIGYTPLTLNCDDMKRISLEKPGFLPKTVETRTGGVSRNIILQPDGAEIVSSRVHLHNNSFELPAAKVLLPAGIGLAAGITSVILKQSADRSYENYLSTGSETSLARTRRYDVYAGVALLVLQASLGYFTYLLFIED